MTKLRSNFDLSFLTYEDQSIDLLDQIKPYVIAIDPGTELVQAGILNHRTNTLIMWITDDDESLGYSTIRNWIKNTNVRFKLVFRTLDRNPNLKIEEITDENSRMMGRIIDPGIPKVKELFVFNDCEFNAIQHSIFSREDTSQMIEVHNSNKNIGTSHFHGNLHPPKNNRTAAKLIQIAFSQMEYHRIENIQ